MWRHRHCWCSTWTLAPASGPSGLRHETHFQKKRTFFFLPCFCFVCLFLSPNSLLWGSLLEEKRLAEICSGRVPGACPPCVRHCPPCVHHVSALAAPPNLVRLLCLPHVCPPCVRSFVRHVPALCQLRSTMCPRLWTLSARGLLWGRATAS